MHVGITTSVMQRGRSGVGQYVLALVRALLAAERRPRLTLFVLEEDLPLFDFARDAVRLVPVAERHRAPAKNILWHQVELPRLARQLGLDVLHVPSYRRMLWPRPCALVATIHDLAPFHVPHKYDWARMLYGRIAVRQLARRQDEIITVSRATARDIGTYFRVPPQRVSVIPNGLDHARFTPHGRTEARAAILQRHGLRPPFFLYVARLEHPAKNHVRLIAAFNRFKAESPSPWQLVLGGSDWHGAPAIHAAIRQSPYREDVRCLGFVPDADLAMWYRAADVFVYPSLFEGFGLPPLEAMACGCPVLAATRGALREVCHDAAASLDPEDVDQIKVQLARLADDEPMREQLRAAGLERARRFDWSDTAEATIDIYSRAVSGGPLVVPHCALASHGGRAAVGWPVSDSVCR